MVYCPNMTEAVDVVGHELTHAVTDADSEPVGIYMNGSLMEGISDAFGEMIERYAIGRNDWLLGADLPPESLKGRSAVRSLRDPGEQGTGYSIGHVGEPGYIGCNKYVHTNAGIPGHAFYQAVLKRNFSQAETIWYYASRTLGSRAGFQAMRVLSVQVELQLDPPSSLPTPIQQAWDAVGVDSSFRDPACPYGPVGLCAGVTAMDETTAAGAPEDEVLATLYRLRNELVPEGALGREIQAVYDRHSDRVSELLLADPELRAKAGQLLQDMNPGMQALLNDAGETEVMTADLLQEIEGFFWELKGADLSSGGGALARDIEMEQRIADLDSLAGRSFASAHEQLDQRFQAAVTRSQVDDETAPPTP